MRKTAGVLLGTLLMTGGLAACSSDSEPRSAPGTPSAAVTASPLASAVLAAPNATGAQPAGITYDTAAVPVGARVSVASVKADGGTKVTMTVAGLLPHHEYGAHVHTKACGAKPADAGPHYQEAKDPVSPSVNPAFANKDNEIWLDFSTDSKGDATASSTVKWSFRADEANAAVIHATHTMTEAGKAGTAGDRLACVTAVF